MAQVMGQQIITRLEAARMMNVEEATVQQWLESGELLSLGLADVSWCYLRYRQRVRDEYYGVQKEDDRGASQIVFPDERTVFPDERAKTSFFHRLHQWLKELYA
jgi:hypothetical protein